MKKIYKIWSVVVVVAFACVVFQSCASSRDKYGCPERIQSSTNLLP